MIYTSHTDITSAFRQAHGFRQADEKEKIMLRKYHLYAVGICAAIALGAAGCSAGVNAETMADSSVTAEANKEETTMNDTTVVESVTGAIESMEESQPEIPQSIRIYGPETKMEDGRLSIDNQSGMSTSGEIILNVADDMTYILDAMTGLPVALEDVKDGDTIYAYIGPAMTMSLPPMTNAVMIFTNLPADAKAPDYVEVKSMVTDAATSKSVLTATDGTEFTLAEDCNIFPYLTRNIVTLDDLTQGKKCVVWSDDENTASKIMLFAE